MHFRIFTNVGLLFAVAMIVSLALTVPASAANPSLSLLQARNADAGADAEAVDAGTANLPTQADIRELARLLSDERIAIWLQEQAASVAPVGSATAADAGLRQNTRIRLDAIRERAADIFAAGRSVPEVPSVLHRAWNEDVLPGDTLRAVVFVIIFLFAGAGLEWLFWQYLAPTLARLEFAEQTSLRGAMHTALQRGGLILGGVAVFALGCIGTFLVFKWPEFVGHLVLGVLIGAVSLRIIVALARFLLAPRVDELRLMPLDRGAARRAFSWTILIATVGLSCLLVTDTFQEIDIMGSAKIAVETTATLIFTLVLLSAVWLTRLRAARVADPAAVADADGADDESTEGLQLVDSNAASSARRSRGSGPFVWTLLIIVSAVLALLGAFPLMWTLVILGLLFSAIALARDMVNDFFDRARDYGQAESASVQLGDLDQTAITAEPVGAQVASVIVDDTVEPVTPEDDEESDTTEYYAADTYRPIAIRLLRFALVIVAVLLLGIAWDRPLWSITDQSALGNRLGRAAIDITIAFLIADLVWVWAKTLIDRRLDSYDVPEHGSAPGPEARMATLLPLFRKVLMVTVIIMVLLIALSSLGINIGPLLAGAGVIGIAVGFGAQTLVRDIVSGIFFLIDDAFRVGEYIEMGDLRGTVESMSLRSLRLRHHRGAVHTIPFGELTALTNHSRDWAIIKMEFRVPFETDLKLVKKLVKQVGKELQQNEDYGHHLIEPLKSQGVRRMEEFNMVVGVKFMSKPGEQWTIRRDAYQRIRDVFDQNGISFAERNVKVEVVGDVTNDDTRKAVVGAAQNAIETQIDPATIPVDDTP